MKVAILSESAADEAALRILTDAILGLRTEPVSLIRFELRRGWSNVVSSLPIVLKHVYYQTDGDGLVIVGDSNSSRLHVVEHNGAAGGGERCRLSQLRRVVRDTRRGLREVPGRQPFRVAVGLAYPAIEAWYLCGRDPHATEVAWARDLDGGARAPQRIRELKQAVYGTDRPSLALETRIATECAQRLAGDLALLETHFPAGFGALSRDLRSWLTPA